MVYKLCYVDGHKAYFTSNWKEQWGDDWNDRPYEHNAGEPYHHYWVNGVEYEIPIKECYFEVHTQVELPCDGHLNSPYSVQDINSKSLPWIRIRIRYRKNVYICRNFLYGVCENNNRAWWDNLRT